MKKQFFAEFTQPTMVEAVGHVVTQTDEMTDLLTISMNYLGKTFYKNLTILLAFVRNF